MNIIFICPSNTRFMPYISYYENEIDYNTNKKYIIWDRFSSEERSLDKIIYKDRISGHKRGVLSYIKYMCFVYSNLLSFKAKDNRILVFGFQTTFFLFPYLFFTKKSYVIDIRDYHYLFKITPKFIFEKAEFVVCSSPEYCELFSENTESIVCHNLYEYGFNLDDSFNYIKDPISVSYMGAIRDFSSQKSLIDNLSNNEKFLIKFHGIGDIIPKLKDYVFEKGTTNIEFTGRYNKYEEVEFYRNASVINMLRDNKSYNDRVALPNRLYSAALFQRPSLCYEGTALAKIVEKYSLGLCMKNDDNIEEALLIYFNSFSFASFKKSCDQFLESVRKDQNLFRKKLQIFIGK